MTRLTFGGTLPGNEIWECGIWMQGDAPTSEASANALADLWWAELVATDGSGLGHAAAQFIWSPQIAMTYTKTYVYPAGGSKATYIGEHTGSITGQASADPLHPNQTAMCVTLRTGYAGRTNRGRIYLPANGVPLTDVANFQTAAGQQIANVAATMIRDWDAASEGTLVVLSQRTSTAKPISSVSVDSRPDTQRRRANRQVITAVANANV